VCLITTVVKVLKIVHVSVKGSPDVNLLLYTLPCTYIIIILGLMQNTACSYSEPVPSAHLCPASSQILLHPHLLYFTCCAANAQLEWHQFHFKIFCTKLLKGKIPTHEAESPFKVSRFKIFPHFWFILVIPLQAWTGPDGYGSLRLPDFETIGTWGW
jgi:hypothetical protein